VAAAVTPHNTAPSTPAPASKAAPASAQKQSSQASAQPYKLLRHHPINKPFTKEW